MGTLHKHRQVTRAASILVGILWALRSQAKRLPTLPVWCCHENWHDWSGHGPAFPGCSGAIALQQLGQVPWISNGLSAKDPEQWLHIVCHSRGARVHAYVQEGASEIHREVKPKSQATKGSRRRAR